MPSRGVPSSLYRWGQGWGADGPAHGHMAGRRQSQNAHWDPPGPTTGPNWLVSSRAQPRAHEAVALLPVPCTEFSGQRVFVLHHVTVLRAFLSCLKTDCHLVTGSLAKFFT